MIHDTLRGVAIFLSRGLLTTTHTTTIWVVVISMMGTIQSIEIVNSSVEGMADGDRPL